jgi:hypothetical protein
MTTFLLDTSVIIDGLNNKRGRPALMLELLNDGHVLACCPINATECMQACGPRKRPPQRPFVPACSTARLPYRSPAQLASSSAIIAARALVSISVT